MTIDQVFNIVVVVFTVSNLAAMGLELDARKVLGAYRNLRFVGLTLFWGWVAGPAIAYLITRVVPLAEGHAAGLLLVSMAPTAPFFPIMVRKARGDMSFAGAFMLLSTVGTVIFLPLEAPFLLEGVTVSTAALIKPLLAMVLLPLVIGLVIKVSAASVAARLFPVIKKIGGLSLLITLVMTLWLYGGDMLRTIGSFAPGTQILFYLVITLLSYKVGLGLTQGQRSGLALGMCTRNIAAVFAAYFGIPNPPEGLFVMVVLVVPLAAIASLVAARVFARQAEVVEGVAA